MILAEEGFADITIRYMGGFWVLFQFLTKATQDNFMSHVGVNSWLSKLQQASNSFSIDERVAWIDIEGVPLCVWSRNTFSRISSKWGSLLHDEDASYFHRKRLCIKTTIEDNIFDTFKIIVKDQDSEVEEILETVFEEGESGEIKSTATKENNKEVLEEVQSDDQFNIYKLLKNIQPDFNVAQQSQGEPQYPPGFTPRDTSKANSNLEHNSIGADNQVKETSEKECGSKASFKEDANASEMKMEHVYLFNIKSCWGNLTFDFVVSPSVGNSGKWLHNDKNLLIISVYAPQELAEKKMLWQYLNYVIDRWKGDVIVMGGLVEVPSGGYSFTWSHKSASKMSKLDRFLIFKDLLRTCPNFSSIILDRYLSYHRPILLREISLDYGPTPFRFFHHLFELEGFDSFVDDTWRDINIFESNAMLKLVKKLKFLKVQIRLWVKHKKDKALNLKKGLKNKLASIDSSFDKGDVTSITLEERMNIMNKLTSLEKIESLKFAQKAKVKWSIEGDENSKYFHGIINKQRHNLAIHGIIVDGEWIEEPKAVKNEFLSHFRDRFDNPCESRLILDMDFPNKLSLEQIHDSERQFTKEEIKGAVWDCGLNKSPGPDGFTCDLVNEVQSAFIANRQILDGPFILNEIIHWCKAKKKQTLIFKIDFEKAFDSTLADLSHLFYDDVVFIGQWCDSNITTIIRVLDCFFHASGLRINLHKSKLMGIAVENSMVDLAANNIGCMAVNLPFSYL
ncbi:RNA-directed DNA polymerase, eukaryota [Tanacetum coccineum]